MSRIRDPFGQALDDLRRRLSDGEHPPGRPIVIIDEARRLRLSPTPVREALARLAGEGLVEPAPGGGYVALRLHAVDIAERYALNAIYLAGALHAVQQAAPEPPCPAPRSGTAIDVFDRLILRAASRSLCLAYQRLKQQLTLIRRAEPAVFIDLAAETDALVALETRADWPAMADAVEAYHRRRGEAVGPLMVALHFTAGPEAVAL